MLFRLFIIILLAVATSFALNAESSGSRFIVQTELNYTKINLHNKWSFSPDKNNFTFNGNGDFWIQFGREFRFVKQRISLTPSIGLNRNGWSFERAGHTGSISYIAPYVSAAFGLHPGKAFLDIGMNFGFATFCFGEIDGKSSTDDEDYFAYYSMGYFTHIGIDFLDQFRAGLEWRVGGIVDSPLRYVYALGGFFAYMF